MTYPEKVTEGSDALSCAAIQWQQTVLANPDLCYSLPTLSHNVDKTLPRIDMRDLDLYVKVTGPFKENWLPMMSPEGFHGG